MIESKRCPWCGYVLKHDSNSFKIDRYAIKCLNCHKWSRPRMNIILPILLFLIKHRVLNHYIMPICFYDNDNNPVTHTLCVRVERVSRIKRDKYKIFALNYSINIDIINNNKNFYIFNKKKIIAEGRLL